LPVFFNFILNTLFRKFAQNQTPWNAKKIITRRTVIVPIPAAGKGCAATVLAITANPVSCLPVISPMISKAVMTVRWIISFEFTRKEEFAGTD